MKVWQKPVFINLVVFDFLTIFITLYHFHQLTNIQTFICNFAFEITTSYF